MTRPLRLEFPGALYHVTARGDNRSAIFLDHDDRQQWLDILGLVCARFNFIVLAYYQMGNHYHLMMETIEGNLYQGMRQLNGLYSQNFNRSYQCIIGRGESPAWLHTDWLQSQFGHSPESARIQYHQFAMEGIGQCSPLKDTQHRLILGDKEFVAQHADRLGGMDFTAVIQDQRRVNAKPLEEYKKSFGNRDEAMARAYATTAFSMVENGKHFGVSDKTVSRAVRRYEKHVHS